ncbi:MAG: GNAT family N-acetyltransferase [candidate division Zixibacteria bacterium RBG_16_53_22]|nr:MAG: GNAT family N-acetyltransferase [candidate division Zixibacteria bacterium RBG_16_53_22]
MSKINRTFEIKPVAADDRERARIILTEEWGSARVVSRGKIYQADMLPGFMAMTDNVPVGLVTFNIEAGSCEIVTLNSRRERIGIGAALIEAVRRTASEAGCRRLWLITTNDNTHALRFYQRFGFVIKAVHANAVAESRKLKPEIPILGYDNIPIRDEIELELILQTLAE